MTAVDRALLDLAVDLARQAGALTLEWFRSDRLGVEHKGDGTPVTVADRAAERFLRDELARHLPDDAVVGEEEADTAGSSGRTWIIDPIDGTKAFTHGVPLYCNLLAMEDEHGPAIGVINLPGLGETVYAGRGLGCFCNGDPARVSTTTALDQAYVSTCAWDDWDDAALGRIKATGAAMRTWGDGYGYALVATGRIDAMIDPTVARWDVAPMPVIIGEAGGRFSALDGEAGADRGSGIATNGALHDELLTVMAGGPR
ncbi:MAG: hypothetical protein KDB36_02345 [Acidimicrobiales bacterium]|nr:hypothetical protein [Acidimicrobiales bacterium]